MLDVVREYKPRLVPAQVIAELAVLCKVFGIAQVYGDKYAIGFQGADAFAIRPDGSIPLGWPRLVRKGG